MTAAQELAGSLQQMLYAALRDHGHGACRWSDQAQYMPDTQEVVCGCGVPAPFVMPSNGEAAKQLATLNERHPEPVTRSGMPTAIDPIQATLALIDPTQHYTPVDLEKRILDVLARMETGQLAERAACDIYYECKRVFEQRYNVAVLASEERAADLRKADAMVKCKDEHEALIRAEQAYKGLKEAMHNLRGTLSGYQSVAKSVGLDYQAGGSNR